MVIRVPISNQLNSVHLADWELRWGNLRAGRVGRCVGQKHCRSNVYFLGLHGSPKAK